MNIFIKSQDIFRRKSSNLSDKFNGIIESLGIEKIQANDYTGTEMLNLFGKDSNSLKNRLMINKKPIEEENKGQFFTKSEEIPKENRELIEKNNNSSTKGLALKDIHFTQSFQNSSENDQNSHYAYLEKQLSALKRTTSQHESRTIKEENPNLKQRPSIFGDKTINTVKIPEKALSNSSELIQEERDEIIFLNDKKEIATSKNIKVIENGNIFKNDSFRFPSFGEGFGMNLKIVSDSSFNDEMMIEKKKLLEKLEILQRDENELEQEKNNLMLKMRKNLLVKKVYEKNQKITILKETLLNSVKMNEHIDFEEEKDVYLRKLQQKFTQLQNDNILFKQLLKTTSSDLSNGHVSLNSRNCSQKPIISLNSSEKALNFLSMRQNSFRLFKSDNRSSVIVNENERKSNNSEEFFLKDLEITTNFKETVQRLKLCCLKNKGVLYKNQEIQIGVLSDLQNYKEKKLIKIYLYFENISSNNLISNVFMRFKANENINIWAKSQEECINILRTREQIVKEVIIDYKNIPFNFALLDFKYQFLDKITRNIIALPNSIVKFINFLDLDAKEIYQFWSQNKGFAIKTEEFEMNNDLFDEKNSFSRFFSFFFEIKLHKKNTGTFLRREFYCKYLVLGLEGAVKLKIKQHNNVGNIVGVLKAILLENEKNKEKDRINLCDFLLDSFKFLLMKI